MQLRIIDESDIDEEMDQSIKRGLCICFPVDRDVYSKIRAWNGYVPEWTVVIEDDGAVIAHAAVIDKEILVRRESIRTAGVMNVYVLPEYRKKGVSATLMNAAMGEAAHRNMKVGLLFCKAWLERVYTSVGWKRLNGRVITRVDKDNRELPLSENVIVMYYPLRLSDFPPGNIHLLGNEW